MPAQLMSPAGLVRHDSMYGRSSDSPASEEHSFAGVGGLLRPSHGAGAGLSRRPPPKRSASTASVHDHIMDSLNPHKQAEEIARMNTASRSRARHARASSVAVEDQHSLSDDDDMSSDGIGVQEDWEIEDESPRRGGALHDDPFTTTPPAHLVASGSSMMIDGPPGSASPTPATRRGNLTMLASSARKGALPSMDSDDDMDDSANNPFYVKATNGPPRAPTKKHKTAAPHADKISYVFRGKRITYDAPLDSLFPAEDEDDIALNLKLKSGPRVLFPSPPTPAPSLSSNPTSISLSTPQKQANVSPEATAARKAAITAHVMQTPRRQPANSSSTLCAETPREGLAGERKKPVEEPIRFIPPTPASLPQKTKEQIQLERERLHGAMRGMHAAPHQQGEHIRQRRYGPYPPR